MKKLLLFIAVLMVSTVSFAQFANIGIIGSATPGGWDADTDLVTTDGVVYTYANLTLTAGQIKFRQDDAWVNNWGGTAFPSGTAVFNAGNITVTPGTYNVSFNLTTLAYSFVATVNYDDVTISGTGIDIEMFTTNGVNYVANNVAVNGSVVFTLNGVNTNYTATVTENNYNVTFNSQTGAYSFDFVRISLIGAGVVDWNTDTNLSTTNGIDYTLSNFTFPGGEAKFRLNNDYNPGWGGTDFPAGIGSTDGGAPNIMIAAGTYDVAFNRITGAYSFNTPAGVKDFAANTVKVYPNPAQNSWNFEGTTAISNVAIVDVTGKVVYTRTFDAAQVAVDASGFASGVYFARVQSGNAMQTIKIVKK